VLNSKEMSDNYVKLSSIVVGGLFSYYTVLGLAKSRLIGGCGSRHEKLGKMDGV
jgi:hypothetical protein